MARTLAELISEDSEWSMDEDNIYIVYNSDEEVEYIITATKIAEHLGTHFDQDVRLYSTWGHTKTNTDTDQRGMKIKNIMYDIIAQCLDQEELDRIEVLKIENGPWFFIPEAPEDVEPPVIEFPDDPDLPPEGE